MFKSTTQKRGISWRRKQENRIEKKCLKRLKNHLINYYDIEFLLKRSKKEKNNMKACYCSCYLCSGNQKNKYSFNKVNLLEIKNNYNTRK